jgi:hypothetical protein
MKPGKHAPALMLASRWLRPAGLACPWPCGGCIAAAVTLGVQPGRPRLPLCALLATHACVPAQPRAQRHSAGQGICLKPKEVNGLLSSLKDDRSTSMAARGPADWSDPDPAGRPPVTASAVGSTVGRAHILDRARPGVPERTCSRKHSVPRGAGVGTPGRAVTNGGTPSPLTSARTALHRRMRPATAAPRQSPDHGPRPSAARPASPAGRPLANLRRQLGDTASCPAAISGGECRAFAVATSPSQRALGLTVRANVVRSTAISPKVGR